MSSDKGTDAAVGRLSELTQHGYKRTTQRAVILDILESASHHMTAEEIAREVEERNLALNRSTIYRTLETLAAIGVVQATRMGRALHYEMSQEGEEHHHVRCSRCHAMVHLDAGAVDRVLNRLAAERGFEVIDIQILVRGLCKTCQPRKSRRAN
jgi:Fur family ferric uptake transcriptional regulator